MKYFITYRKTNQLYNTKIRHLLKNKYLSLIHFNKNYSKMRYIILFLFMTASITCSKNETICTDCVDMMLKEYNMVRYEGQENWCSSLSLSEYENKQYFVYDNCLADM